MKLNCIILFGYRGSTPTHASKEFLHSLGFIFHLYIAKILTLPENSAACLLKPCQWAIRIIVVRGRQNRVPTVNMFDAVFQYHGPASIALISDLPNAGRQTGKMPTSTT
ncbi:MAG: hypothetical protein PVG81_12650, partial [Desulfobacterales bacterium]